jgi:hypothetical protein
MKRAAIWLVCGAITVAIGAVNIWLGIIALPIMYSVAQSLAE